MIDKLPDPFSTLACHIFLLLVFVWNRCSIRFPIQLLRREITTRSMKHSYSPLQKSLFTVNVSKQWLVKIICGELTQNEVFHTGKTAIHILVETGENDSPTEIHLSVVFRADPKATHLEYTSTKIVINIGFFFFFFFLYSTWIGKGINKVSNNSNFLY